MFRILSSVLSLALLALPAASFAAEKLTLKELLTKSIDAHGGKKVIEKYPAQKSTSKGTMDIGGNEISFTVERLIQDPDKLKGVIKFEVTGKEFTMVQIINGNNVSITNNGEAAEVPDKAKAEAIDHLRLHRMTTIIPLLNEKEFEVKLLDETGKVDDKEAYILLVKCKADKEGRETKLLIDTKSFLITKIQRRGVNALQEEADQEMLLTDYKKVEGIMLPMKTKILHDGKKYIELETSEVKFLEKIEAKEFEIAK